MAGADWPKAHAISAAISRPLGDGLRSWDLMAAQIEPEAPRYRQARTPCHYFNGTTA
jgi:hypothetical protein